MGSAESGTRNVAGEQRRNKGTKITWLLGFLGVRFFFGHGIAAAGTPGMTTAKTFHRQPTSRDRAMLLQRFNGVLGAARRETASGGCAKDIGLRGRQRPAIQAHEENAKSRRQKAESAQHARRPLHVLHAACFILHFLKVRLCAGLSKSPFPPRQTPCPLWNCARPGPDPAAEPTPVDATETLLASAGVPDCGPPRCRSCRW